MEIKINTGDLLGEETTLRDAVIQEMASRLLVELRKDAKELLSREVAACSKTVVAEQIKTAAELTLDEEFQEVDRYGDLVGKAKSIRKRILDYVKDQCVVKGENSGYSSDQNVFTQIIRSTVESQAKVFGNFFDVGVYRIKPNTSLITTFVPRIFTRADGTAYRTKPEQVGGMCSGCCFAPNGAWCTVEDTQDMEDIGRNCAEEGVIWEPMPTIEAKPEPTATLTVVKEKSTQQRNVLSNGDILIAVATGGCSKCFWNGGNGAICGHPNQVPKNGDVEACSATNRDDNRSIAWVKEEVKPEPRLNTANEGVCERCNGKGTVHYYGEEAVCPVCKWREAQAAGKLVKTTATLCIGPDKVEKKEIGVLTSEEYEKALNPGKVMVMVLPERIQNIIMNAPAVEIYLQNQWSPMGPQMTRSTSDTLRISPSHPHTVEFPVVKLSNAWRCRTPYHNGALPVISKAISYGRCQGIEYEKDGKTEMHGYFDVNLGTPKKIKFVVGN